MLLSDMYRALQQRVSNPAPDNRLYNIFFLALRLIKIEFKMNNFKTSDRFFKWINLQFDSGAFSEDLFPASWRVSLAYLKGRFEMYHNNLGEARTHLRAAFERCLPESTTNQRKILKFLVPVQMNFYVFPSKALLEKYQLNEYIDIAEACQEGDMVKFEETLSAHMDLFVHGGVYMAVEKLR